MYVSLHPNKIHKLHIITWLFNILLTFVLQLFEWTWNVSVIVTNVVVVVVGWRPQCQRALSAIHQLTNVCGVVCSSKRIERGAHRGKPRTHHGHMNHDLGPRVPDDGRRCRRRRHNPIHRYGRVAASLHLRLRFFLWTQFEHVCCQLAGLDWISAPPPRSGCCRCPGATNNAAR